MNTVKPKGLQITARESRCISQLLKAGYGVYDAHGIGYMPTHGREFAHHLPQNSYRTQEEVWRAHIKYWDDFQARINAGDTRVSYSTIKGAFKGFKD